MGADRLTTPPDSESDLDAMTGDDDGADDIRWVDDPTWRPAWPALYARKAGGRWESAHRRLIGKLRKECQQYINRVLDNLRNELGEPHNGWDFSRRFGAGQVVLAAETQLKLLAQRAQDNQEAHRRFQAAPRAADFVKPAANDWWQLWAILLGCIAIEAVANSYLLASALTTGLVGAFITAIVVSVLNVGALGAGAGLLLSTLRRRGVLNSLFYGGLVLWGALALLLNLLVGRHREAFARIIDAREQQVTGVIETDMAAVAETAATIPYIPASWQFESLLFFCLGLALCGVGFYKGYSVIKSKDPNRGKHKLDIERSTIIEEYRSLPANDRRQLTDDLRTDVAGWVQGLSTDLQHARDRMEDVEHSWRVGTHLAQVEALFMVAYNDVHAAKIDGKMLKRHREEEGIDLSLPATQADRAVLVEVDEIIREWSDVQKEAFFADVDARTREIDVLWTNYKPMIVNVLAGPKSAVRVT